MTFPVKPPKEVTFHIQLVSMLRWCLRPTVMFRHVPNGEHRDPRTAAKLKAMGTLAGSADLEFHWVEAGTYLETNGAQRMLLQRRVLHLELKVAKRPPNHAQVMFAMRVRDLGDGYHIVRSVDEAIGIIGTYGLIKPDVEVCGQRWAAAHYDPTADFAGSLDEAYRAIRERRAAGGPGWTPKEPT